jgi:hypothetical protein
MFRIVARTWRLVPGVFLTVCLLVGCAGLTSEDPQRPFAVVFRLKAPAATRVSVVGVSFAKTSSHSVDEGRCPRDRPRHTRRLSIAGRR